MEIVWLRLKILINKNNPDETLSRVTFDSNHSFENHITSLCTKTSNKLYTLVKISYHMDLNERKSLIEAFITSQFGYCHLI